MQNNMGHLLKPKTIIDVSNQLRDQGKKVVFTHGSFDLFHSGHSYLLNTSRKKGDILIVGIESEERIRKYKNPQRPIIPDSERIHMLLNHTAVDFVLFITGKVPWSNSYYVGLYEKLSPNIVTFGKTFGHKEKFTNKEFQLKNVAYTQIKELPLETGSTTKIINRIKTLL